MQNENTEPENTEPKNQRQEFEAERDKYGRFLRQPKGAAPTFSSTHQPPKRYTGKHTEHTPAYYARKVLGMRYRIPSAAYKAIIERFPEASRVLTVEEIIQIQIAKKAMSGDVRAYTAIMNRAKGLPKQEVEISGGLEERKKLDFTNLSDAEIASAIEILSKAEIVKQEEDEEQGARELSEGDELDSDFDSEFDSEPDPEFTDNSGADAGEFSNDETDRALLGGAKQQSPGQDDESDY